MQAAKAYMKLFAWIASFVQLLKNKDKTKQKQNIYIPLLYMYIKWENKKERNMPIGVTIFYLPVIIYFIQTWSFVGFLLCIVFSKWE